MGEQFSSDDKPLPPRHPDMPTWDQLFGAFQSGLAEQSNRELIAAFQPICSRFSKALKLSGCLPVRQQSKAASFGVSEQPEWK
jgi:hypothetical protein